MSLSLPDINSKIEEQRARLRKEPNSGGGAAVSNKSGNVTKARAASDPIKMFDGNFGDDEDARLPSRSSTVLGNQGSFVDGQEFKRQGGKKVKVVAGQRQLAVTSMKTVRPAFDADDEPFNNANPQGMKPTKELLGQDRAKEHHDTTSVEPVTRNWEGSRKIGILRTSKSDLVGSGPKKIKKTKKELQDEAANARSFPSSAQKMADLVQQRDLEALVVLAHERSKQRLEEKGGKLPKLMPPPESRALVLRTTDDARSTGALRSQSPPRGRETSTALVVSTVISDNSSGVGFSPNTTMDRTIPDPNQVPRIVDAAGLSSQFSGTLQSNPAGPMEATNVSYLSVGKKGPTKCFYGKKLERKLAHPLQEERPFFDVWPANNSSVNKALAQAMSGTAGGQSTLSLTNAQPGESAFVRPQLLNDLEDAIRSRLSKLNGRFPSFAATNAVNAPSEEALSPRRWTSALKSGKPRGELYSGESPAVKAKANKRNQQKRHISSRTETDEFAVDDLAVPKAVGDRNIGALTMVQHHSNDDENKEERIADGDDESDDGDDGVDKALRSFSTEEDRFRAARVQIFSEGCREFADQFKSYKKLLLWFVHEFDGFMTYCHRNVMSPEAQLAFKQRTQEAVRQEVSEEVNTLKRQLASALEEVQEVTKSYKDLKAASAKHSQVIADKDDRLERKNRELAEAAEGRAALLSRMERLEKEIWNQKNLMEGPEKKCQELKKELEEAEKKIQRGLETIDELAKERAGLKIRIEKLEEQLTGGRIHRRPGGAANELNSSVHNGGASGGGSAPNPAAVLATQQSELLNFKKREQELIEHMALYKAKYDKSVAKIKQLTKVNNEAREERGSMTPRPNWEEVEAFIPRAPSSAQRTLMAAVEMSSIIEAKDIAVEELTTVKEMLGSVQRNLADVVYGETLLAAPGSKSINRVSHASLEGNPVLSATEALKEEDKVDDLVTRMQTRFFPKLGLGSQVPTYLKGMGFVPNLKLKRLVVQGYCKMMWIERELHSKATVPVDQFLSRFCSKFCPPDVESDTFAYNLHHSLHWYAFDPVIRFTKDYITGRMDEGVFYSMQRQVRDLQERLTKACSQPQLDFGDEADDEELERQREVEDQQANATSEAEGQAPPQAQDVFSKTYVIAALMENLPEKAEVQVKELIMALSRDCSGAEVSMKTLFKFDPEIRRFSFFLEEWYDQFLADKALFQKQVMDAMYQVETDDNNELSPPDVAAMMWSLDPDAPVQYMDPLVAALFGVKVEELFPEVAMHTDIRHEGCMGERQYNCGDTITIDLFTLLKRLKIYPLQRFTAPKVIDSAPKPPASGSVTRNGKEDDDDDDTERDDSLNEKRKSSALPAPADSSAKEPETSPVKSDS